MLQSHCFQVQEQLLPINSQALESPSTTLPRTLPQHGINNDLALVILLCVLWLAQAWLVYLEQPIIYRIFIYCYVAFNVPVNQQEIRNSLFRPWFIWQLNILDLTLDSGIPYLNISLFLALCDIKANSLSSAYYHCT